MICPNCEHHKIGVEETRKTQFLIWRVRRCEKCGWRVTTKEGYAPEDEQSIPWAIRNPSIVKRKRDEKRAQRKLEALKSEHILAQRDGPGV